MPKPNLKKFRGDVEVRTPYIFETLAENELQARELFQRGACSYVGRGPDNRQIMKVEEVEE